MKHLLLATLLLLLPNRLEPAPENPCDKTLLQPPGNPYGYRLRGDRCEGLYMQEVSGAPLTVVSWTAAFDNYDLKSAAPLTLSWEAPESGNVRLQARGLRRRLYFRMDAIRESGSRSFSWSPDVLAAVGIPKPELGVSATMETHAGKTLRTVYLPLKIRQSSSPSPADGYHLLVVPGTELKEMFISLAPVDGSERDKIKDGEPLGYGYYPADRAVDVPITGVKTPGIYHLEIGATLRNGGISTTEIYFYHPRS